MRSISTLLKGAKNRLDQKEPFMLLIEISKTGWWRLNYDGLTVAFNEEATVSGSTATARILFVEPLTATTGYLIVTEVTGNGIFANDQVITDEHGGAGVVNGALNIFLTAGMTFRFARNTDDVLYDGNLYYAFPCEMGAVRTGQGELPTMDLVVANILRMPEGWLRKGDGFLGEQVRLMVVWCTG